MPIIHTTAERRLSDKQVFEYDKTLSLPVDKKTFGKSHIGDVVKVGDKYGILVTEIAPTADEIKAVEDAIEAAGGIYNPALNLTGGLNQPGYASVRVRGGVFKMTVSHSGAKPVGSTVYAKAPSGGKIELTTTAADGATAIGFLYNALPTGSDPVEVPVVFTA